MPTAAIMTFGGGQVEPCRDPDLARQENVQLKASITYPAGTVLGEIAASPGVFGPYATGAVDGLQFPVAILRYACVTDASSNVTFGAGPAGTSEFSQTSKSAPVWTRGKFFCADLVGLDAAGAAKLGRIVRGDTTTGEIAVNGG